MDQINKANDRLKALEEELEEAYRRWDELESLAAKFGGEPTSDSPNGS